MSFEIAEVGRLVKQLQWTHHRAVDSRLRRHGVTIVQWDALRAISLEPDATARQLAAATFQSEQSFGVMAAGMERRGLITRTPGAGRSIEHRLTPDGERLIPVGSAIADEVLATTIGAMPAEERDALGHLLGRALAGGEARTPGQ